MMSNKKTQRFKRFTGNKQKAFRNAQPEASNQVPAAND